MNLAPLSSFSLLAALMLGTSSGATAWAPAPKKPAGVAAKTPKAPVTDAAGQRVARALEKALRARVSSPGGKLRLTIRPTARAREGYFSEVVISARPARMRKMVLSQLDVRARDVRVDVPHLLSTGKVRTLASRTSLRAVVSEADLTRLLAKGRRTRDMGLTVRYNADGSMRMAGKLNYTLLNGPVSGVARLRLARDFKVHLDIVSLQLRGAEVPGFVRDQLQSRINPVLDYEEVPFRPQFRGLSVSGSNATLRA